jgi:nucleotide-binding universal stress UspA family protein
MPVFFGLAGLSVDLTILRDPTLFALTVGLVAIASVGKFAGAFVGGEIGGMTRWESLALACGMNARGSTEVIVASIGLSMGVLTQSLFTMIVTMAVLTTMAMPPMLRWVLVRLPLGKEEKARLEREEFEANGFVANLERLLLAVDESDNGRFASRVTGLIAGQRGIPTTVLHVGPDAKRQEEKRSTETSAEAAVKAGAVAGAQADDETKPAAVDVLTRAKEAGTQAAVADEARKGYGLMVIGLLRTLAPDGGFHRELARVAAGFDGPLALVVARGRHLEKPTDSAFRILLPINGTEASGRAAEVAVALARANDVPITALYVPDMTTTRSGARRARPGTATRRYEEAILKDVVALADRYDTAVRTTVRVDMSPDEAILREARGGHDLIVMGADRRPGDTLFFGNVAASVIEKAKASILLVTS